MQLRSIDAGWELDEVYMPLFNGCGYLTWLDNRVYIRGNPNGINKSLSNNDILNLGYGDGNYCMAYNDFDPEQFSFWEVKNNFVGSTAVLIKADLFSFGDANTNVLQTAQNKKDPLGWCSIRIGSIYFDINKQSNLKGSDITYISSTKIEVKPYDYYRDLLANGFKMFTGLDYETCFP